MVFWGQMKGLKWVQCWGFVDNKCWDKRIFYLITETFVQLILLHLPLISYYCLLFVSYYTRSSLCYDTLTSATYIRFIWNCLVVNERMIFEIVFLASTSCGRISIEDLKSSLRKIEEHLFYLILIIKDTPSHFIFSVSFRFVSFVYNFHSVSLQLDFVVSSNLILIDPP